MEYAGLAKLTAADTAMSFLWVFLMSCLPGASMAIAKSVDWHGGLMPIIVGIAVVLLTSFSILGRLLGGASWNPTAPVAFYAAGAGKDSLFSLSVRLPAMALGGVMGALSIVELMPEAYKHTLGGPKLKVDIHTGALAEGLLTFTITLALLWVALNGPKNPLIKISLLVPTTLTLVMLGGPYTGPAMNPQNAFGWAYVNKKHTSNEHLYVYWVMPFIGALAASGVYRLLFKPSPPPPAPKEKSEKEA